MTEWLRKLGRDFAVTFIGVLAALFIAMLVMTLYRDHLKVMAMWQAMSKPPMLPFIPHTK
jgi:hypothetical protein